jgi:hypothetical protein
VVARNNSWHPSQIDELEFNDDNYRGLFWWYNEILKEIAATNKQNTK